MTARQYLSNALPLVLVREWRLLGEMTQREIAARYRGSMLGVLWALVAPIAMLAVFTFVFSTVFEARWGRAVGDRSLFALMLFPGMIIYGYFAEIMSRAPSVVVSQPNFVRKVVFPVELLPAVAVASAGAQALIGLAIVILFKLVLTGSVPATAPWVFVVLLPFVVFLLGLAWLLAALGVYLRDIAQVAGVVATALMFLSPVFYPLEALPPEFREIAVLNPMTLIIEETRKVLVVGEPPDLGNLAVYLVLATAFASLALYAFRRARKGFADVL